jgi:type II secretory pathway component PulK
MLVTLVTVLLLLVVACAIAVGVLVVPFVVAVDMAERRRFSTARWGAVALVGSGLAVMVAALIPLQHLSGLLLTLSVALAWTGPGVLALLDASQRRVGGTQGAHEL